MAEKKKIIQAQAGFQERFVRTNVDFCVGGGVLAPQPKNSLVATPNGFVKIGDLKVGDVICNPMGGTQTVNIVWDKPSEKCVEFTLQDGRKVKSAISHNWLVKNYHGNVIDMKAEEIINYIENSKNRDAKHVNRLRIPMCSPVYLEDKYKEQRVLHPYLIGVLLGDGCLSEKIYRADIGSNDIEVIDRVRSFGYNIVKESKNPKSLHYCVRDKYVVDELKKLGLWGHLAATKFIPDCYKYASIEDRMELLRGLFDTDGCCVVSENRPNGRVKYTTTSERLAKDLQEVIWSIGGKCKIHITKAQVREYKDRDRKCSTSYNLLVWTKNDADLFALKRKKDNTTSEEDKRVKTFLSIIDYQMLPSQEVRCINVSGNEHLYLTDGYVITENCGKSYSAVLSVAEAASQDGRFRGLFLRNNLGDARASGGLLDTFRDIYANAVDVVESGEPRVTFKESGAKIDVTHVSDQSREKVLQRFKGRQYDFIYFDEGTGFTWECFAAIYTRNRGTAEWTGKVRMTTNPDRNHWLRKFLDWYIGADGFIIPERDGVVRYFFMAGETVDDVVWGDSKKEVYHKCKSQIDRMLAKVNGTIGHSTYEDIIKSFTFYQGKMSENKATLGNNSGYIGSVAVMGGRNAQQLLEGNWNVSPDEDLDAPIPQSAANEVFMNDPQINNDKWVTCDLADTGTDNFLAIAWNGFHIEDILILGHTTPRQNAERLKEFAASHDVADSHIIYDGIRGTYINDYIEEAIPFVSYRQPIGIYGRGAQNLKAECYMRVVQAINKGYISFDESLALRQYEHQNLKERISIQNEFIEECSVVRFKEIGSGKKGLLSKKEMNAKLGKNRSMDLLDPIAMRFLPVLEYPYGEELERSAVENYDDDDDDGKSNNGFDIYNEHSWY